MLNKKSITLFTLIIIMLAAIGCSADTQSPIDDGGLVAEEQPIDDGGLVAEDQPMDNDGLVPSIEDTAWKLLSIRDHDTLMAADESSPAIIEFKADGTYNMSTGCGEMGGNYTLDGESLTLNVEMTTLVESCTEAQVAQALAVENLIDSITQYSFDSDMLVLVIDENNDALFEQLHMIDDGGLVGEDQPMDNDGLVPSIEDTAWKLLSIRDYDALMAADEASPAIIEFKADGTYNMSTGCGEMSGTYTVDGEKISFVAEMTTVVADCTEAQVLQALDVEDLMRDVTSYGFDGDMLVLAIDENNDALFEQLQKIDDGGLDG